MNLAWGLVLQGRWTSTEEHLGTAEGIYQDDDESGTSLLPSVVPFCLQQTCLASALQTVYQNRDSGVMRRWIPGSTTLQLLGLGEVIEPPEPLSLCSTAVACAVLTPEGDSANGVAQHLEGLRICHWETLQEGGCTFISPPTARAPMGVRLCLESGAGFLCPLSHLFVSCLVARSHQDRL